MPAETTLARPAPPGSLTQLGDLLRRARRRVASIRRPLGVVALVTAAGLGIVRLLDDTGAPDDAATRSDTAALGASVTPIDASHVATLDDDQRSLTLPMPLARPDVDVGQRVELVAVSMLDDWSGATAVVVAEATVRSIDDDGITVVCGRDEALAVVEALALGAVEILGGGDPVG